MHVCSLISLHLIYLLGVSYLYPPISNFPRALFNFTSHFPPLHFSFMNKECREATQGYP